MDMSGVRSKGRRPFGSLFHFLDYLNWTFEKMQTVMRTAVLDVGARCFKFVWFCLSSPPRVKVCTEQLTEKSERSLHSSTLSFFDTFLCVSGVPSYMLDGSGTSDICDSKETESKVKRESALPTTSSESVSMCCFSSDSSKFAICYVSGKVIVWDTDHGKQVEETFIKHGVVHSVSFLGKEDSVMLICMEDYTCWKWNIGSENSRLVMIFDKKDVAIIDGYIFYQRSDFNADGTKLVLSSIIDSEEGPVLARCYYG